MKVQLVLNKMAKLLFQSGFRLSFETEKMLVTLVYDLHQGIKVRKESHFSRASQ